MTIIYVTIHTNDTLLYTNNYNVRYTNISITHLFNIILLKQHRYLYITFILH